METRIPVTITATAIPKNRTSDPVSIMPVRREGRSRMTRNRSRHEPLSFARVGRALPDVDPAFLVLRGAAPVAVDHAFGQRGGAHGTDAGFGLRGRHPGDALF